MSRRRSIVTPAGAVWRHGRERGPEGRKDPGVDPVGLRQLAAGPGEVPGLARAGHDGREPPGMQRLQERPVHPPRGLHGDPLRPAVPEDAGDLAKAVRVAGGRPVPPVQAMLATSAASIPATVVVMSPAPVLAMIRFSNPASIQDPGG